jgi:hypothetical protein
MMVGGPSGEYSRGDGVRRSMTGSYPGSPVPLLAAIPLRRAAGRIVDLIQAGYRIHPDEYDRGTLVA